MTVRKIKNKYYLVSKRSKKLYTLDKNLNCNCKGFLRWNKCYHQKEVIKYLESGEWIKNMGQNWVQIEKERDQMRAVKITPWATVSFRKAVEWEKNLRLL